MNKEKLQKKDGKASGKSRKKTKFIKEQLESMLQLNLTDETLTKNFRKIGFIEEDFTIQSGIICSLIVQALHGNLKAFQLIRDQIGQNPKEDVIEPLSNIFFINDISTKLKEAEKLKEK